MTKPNTENEAIHQLHGEYSVNFDFETSEHEASFWKSILSGLPSWRIIRLATHGKKKRTQKKNMRRIIKYWRTPSNNLPTHNS